VELVKVIEGLYCLSGPANIGLIEGKNGLIIIDTGLDSGAAKRIIKAADAIGRHVSAVINTHAHADHFGGNAFLVKKTGAKVYAPFFEQDVIRYPFWEPVFLCGGAAPILELRQKFFEAEASPVDFTLYPGKCQVDGIDLEIIHLPGHTFEQVGIIYRDVLFCADSIFPKNVLQKHQLPFGVDIDSWLSTLEVLAKTSFENCIPGHGDFGEPYQDAALRNISWLKALSSEIHSLLIQERKDIPGLLAGLCARRDISFNKTGAYFLLQTALTAHLTYLQKKDLVKAEVSRGRLLWVASGDSVKL